MSRGEVEEGAQMRASLFSVIAVAQPPVQLPLADSAVQKSAMAGPPDSERTDGRKTKSKQEQS